jgi:hypothetical protein
MHTSLSFPSCPMRPVTDIAIQTPPIVWELLPNVCPFGWYLRKGTSPEAECQQPRHRTDARRLAVSWWDLRLLCRCNRNRKIIYPLKSTSFWDIAPCSVAWEQVLLATYSQAGFLLSLFFDPEEGGDIFPRNVGWFSTDYTALYPSWW